MGEQGQAAGARTDLHMVVEALRANRDRATNLSGLAQLHKLLKGLNGHEVLQAYLEQSPTCTELQAIWDVQLSVNDHSITIALLQLLARMLQMPLANQPVLSADTATALDQLAHDVIARRLKAIYFNLGSDMRDRMVATLQLMAALAKRSTAAARELVQAFDFELPAFYKASLPPREQRDAPADQAQQWRRLWQHKDPLKRPTCSAFVDFAHALLASCNTALLAMVLPIRPLFAGWLNCLAQHPSASATATVRLLLDKVLVDDGSIPPHLQAEPFSITALTQLAQLSGQEDSESDAATAASQAAHDLLMALCTDPAHGLCPADRADSTEAEGRAADASLSGRSSASGRRRLLQLMQKLRATELSRHAQLLMAIAGRHPSMAAAFLAVAPYSLEPQLSVRWLATATLVGRLVEAAAAGAAPGFLQRAQRGERPPFMDSGAVRQLLRNLFPPCLTKAALSHGIQHSSPLVRYTTLCLLLRIFHTAEHALTDLNAALEAAAATPGQAATPLHPGAIAADVAQDNVTVPATPKVLFAAAHSQLTNAQEPGGRHTEGPATAFHLEAPWRGFSTRLRSAVRAYLPDPQALLSQFSAMHAAAVKEAASRPASQPAADVATEPSLKPPKLSKQAAMKQGPGATLGVQQAGMEAAEATQLDLEQRSMGPEHSSEAEGSERDGEMPPDECQSMSADDADFMEVGDGHSDSDTNEAERTEWRHAAQADAADLALAKLLGVLTAYQQLLPDAMGDSRFDAGRLLTQDVLSLSPLVQHALLKLLHAASSMKSPSSGSRQLAALHAPVVAVSNLVPLLRLLTGAPAAHIASLAAALLHDVVRQAVGCEGNPSETALWLGLLPACPPEDSAEERRCGEAVQSFLAEAVALVARRPHELHELTQSLLQPGALPAVLGFSPLAVCCLRQVLKVAESARLPASARAATAAYVSGVLSALLQLQADPHPLALVIVRHLATEASQRAAAAQQEAGSPSPANPPLAQQPASVLNLSSEAQPLASLAAAAHKVLAKQADGVPHIAMAGQSPGHNRRGVGTDAVQVSRKRRKLASGHTAVAEPAAGAEAMQLLVVGEAESAAQLERLLSSLQDAGISNPLTPSDLVSLKTALSCAPAPAVEVALPRLVKLCASRQDSSFGLVYWACRTHSLLLPEAPPGKKAAAVWQALHEHAPLMLLLQAACGREGGLTSLQEALVTSLKPVPTAQRAVAVRALVLQIRLPRISQPLQPDQLVVLFQLLEHTLQDKQADALACALELRALLAAYLVDDSAADADCIMNRSITQLLSSLLGITSQDGSASAVKEDQVSRLYSPFIHRVVNSAASVLMQQQAGATCLSIPQQAAIHACQQLAPAIPLDSLTRLLAQLLSLNSVDPSGRQQPGVSQTLQLLALQIAEVVGQRHSRCAGSLQSIPPQQLSELAAGVVALCMQHPSASADQALLHLLAGQGAPSSKSAVKASSHAGPQAIDKAGSDEAARDAARGRLVDHLSADQATDMMRYYLEQPTLLRGQIMALLITAWPACQQAFCAQLLNLLQPVEPLSAPKSGSKQRLATASGLAGSRASGYGGSSAEQQQDAAAVLLPAAAAYLGAAAQPEHAMLALYRRLLLAFFSGKWRAAGGSEDAATSLGRHAVDVLRLCLAQQPLSRAAAYKLIQHVVPPKCWPLPASHGAAAQSQAVQPAPPAADLPSQSQQAAVAAMLLQHTLAHPQEREGGEDGRGSQEFGDLAQFAVCCMKTLGRIFKLGDRSEAEEALQRQLMQYLDTCIGDSLAALPNALRETPAFTQLAADVSSFATAVMRARVADAACVKCLRRLLAALLPSAASEEEGTDVGQAQQPGEGAGHAGLDEPNSTADIASGADASEMSNGDTDSNTDASEPVGGGVVNAEVSAIAGQVLGRLVSHSQFVAILLRPQAMALPALPPAAAKLLLPLTSILPAVDCELPGPGQAAPALAAKREIAELMETLLDLQESFADASQPPDLATQARALLPLLLSAYHATSTATDRALLRVMYVMDRQCRQAEQGETEGKSEVGEAAARLDGPLACAGFLFGEAARRAHEKGLLFPQVQHAPDDLTAQRQRVVEEHGALDARRMALATVHFLEHRTLAADELDPHDSVPQAGAAQHDADSSMALSASRCDAAYDPAFMLPFAVQALRTGLLTCQQLATNGLLSLCLRTLATEDPGLRGLAYEALAAALEALDREDFRAQAQMAMLLSCVRLSVTQPFQRLPAVAAVFLAEAAMQLLHPGSAMYPALNKLLLRKPAVDVQDVPLMYQLLMSGSQQHWLERCWLLRLLQAGLRSDLDAQIYRRRFVVELLMTVHDSALADSSVRDLAMGAICAVARAPAYAQDLAKKAGLLPWLASAAGKALIGDCTAISSHAQSTTEAPPALHNAFIEPGSARTSAAAAQLLQVLQRLP